MALHLCMGLTTVPAIDDVGNSHVAVMAGKDKKSVGNEKLARQVFDHTYQMVFGTQGSTLHYAVNLIGIYKTEGTIWYKGEKSKFVESRYTAWNDGVTYYKLDRKHDTVEMYRANSDEKDKYASKFKFDPENFSYSIAESGDNYVITLKAKKSIKGIREVKAVINKRSRAPESLRIKLAFFWTTVKISQFKSGGIDDKVFVFPKNQYRHCKMIDKR